MDNLTALRARDDLLAVVAAWGALRARLTPSGSSAEPVSGSTTPRLPIDVGVSDLLAEIEADARFYGQVLLEEADPEHGCDGACHGTAEHACAGHHCATEGEAVVLAMDCPVRRDAVTTSLMPGLLEQVARRYGHFAAAQDRTALDFCDTAHELRRKVSGLLAQHSPPRWQGPCPEGECPGEIYQRDGQTDARCRECGREVGPVEWRAIMAAAFETRLMTRWELVSALVVMKRPVKPNTLDRWVSRGRLVAEVEDPELFRFADGFGLAEKYDTTERVEGSAA
jgi:hypothetical protein